MIFPRPLHRLPWRRRLAWWRPWPLQLVAREGGPENDGDPAFWERKP